MVLDTESSMGGGNLWEARFSLLLPEAKNRYRLPTSMGLCSLYPGCSPPFLHKANLGCLTVFAFKETFLIPRLHIKVLPVMSVCLSICCHVLLSK